MPKKVEKCVCIFASAFVEPIRYFVEKTVKSDGNHNDIIDFFLLFC